MLAIKTIRTHNIQSHKDVNIELPERGLVVFTGDNSNGKSVIRKVLEDTISGAIKSPRVRKPLINRTASEGYCEITRYDGASLFININLEASRTFVRYTSPSGTETTRYLSDKSIGELMREFGFHYNENREVSLNICDSDNSILFFKTSHVTNGDILNSALVDTRAQKRAEALRERYHEAIALRQSFNDNLRVALAAKSEIKLYDVEAETSLLKQASYYANILEHVYIPQPVEAQPVPLVLYVNVPKVRVSTYKVPLIISLPKVSVIPLDKMWHEYKTIAEGVCPVCKRPFSVHQTCTSEM